MMKQNEGFSLIELMIVMAVIAVLSGLLFLSPRITKRKEIDKYAAQLCDQITMMQSLTMARVGQWRFCMYEEEGRYYGVQEKKHMTLAGESAGTWDWVPQSGESDFGSGILYEGAVEDSTDYESSENGRTPVFVWRFNQDTGACIRGAGAYRISGFGKTKQIKVYAQSGRCEETDVVEK